MDPKKTGIIISEARKKLKMTQKDLADLLYVSDKAVSKWERGLCFPDISALIPLTEILKINLYDLLRGEKVNKEDVEETLKNTINYSNNEIKRKKKKYIVISTIIISIIALISVISLILMSKNIDLGAITDRDTIYDISYYSNYKTTTENGNTDKLELIITKLPMKWKFDSYKLNDNILRINYKSTYKDVVEAYKDENYIKEVMINNATILFTTVSGIDSVEIKYSDCSYSISKKDLQNSYGISSFDEVSEKENWNKIVTDKLLKDKFVNNTFDLFKKIK